MLKPNEWCTITHRDYVSMCVGFFNRKREEAIVDRRIWYAIVQGWADPKKLPPMERMWPIDGEQVDKPKKISQKDVLKAFTAMQNFGKNKKNIN